jgi:ferrous-iron efflux pump FieF
MDYTPVHDSKKAQQVALGAAACAAVLALAKLILFFMSGSLIIALSAWDSAMDVIVSLTNRKIIQFARLGPDENHPYGHGRAESIAALGQGAMIIGGAIGIVVSGMSQMINFYKETSHSRFEGSWSQVAFFAVASLVSLWVTTRLFKYGRTLNSPALLADGEHYKVDFITNILSGVAIIIVLFSQSRWLDPLLAIGFSIYIFYGGFGLIKKSIHELMDIDIPVEVKERAKNVVLKTDVRVIDVHKLRGRKSGHRYIFDLHVTLPRTLSFEEVHVIIENIEDALEKEFYGASTAHADPSLD